MNNNKYGILIQPSIKLHRQWFREMVKLHGIYVLYRAPKENKHYTTYAEIESNYEKPILVGCIFDQYPTQQTLRKIGWMSELQPDASIIHVDYDLYKLQVGCLFIIPSGLDSAKGRLFRVVSMKTSMVYPSSVVCQIVPEYEDTLAPDTVVNYDDVTSRLLNDEESLRFSKGG